MEPLEAKEEVEDRDDLDLDDDEDDDDVRLLPPACFIFFRARRPLHVCRGA